MGSSATSCGSSTTAAARSPSSRRPSAEDILALKPDGVFLSNGPGDPAATGEYAVPTIKALLETRSRRCSAFVSAIRCSGSRSARRTLKMPQGHHGANHPVKDFTTGKVEIVSMNHGFAVDARLCPRMRETHVSLFDGSNCGIGLDGPAFSVQYHPEASPGPADSHYLFRRFVDLIAAQGIKPRWLSSFRLIDQWIGLLRAAFARPRHGFVGGAAASDDGDTTLSVSLSSVRPRRLLSPALYPAMREFPPC